MDIAYEPNIQRCLMMHIYQERKDHLCVCYQFFKQLRSRFGRKPVLTDEATWYYQACRWLRMKNIVFMELI